MKICFICSEYPEGPHGGVGSFTREISRRLVTRGHEVRVIGVYPKSYPAPDYENDHGVDVFRIRKGEGKFSWIPAWKKQYMQVKEWIEQGKAEIIEAPDSSGWFALWPSQKIPIVLRANGSNVYFSHLTGRTPNRLTAFLEKDSYKRADFLISVSEFTARETTKVFRLNKKFKVIYNGIPIPEKRPENDRDTNTVVFAGTLIEKKGVIQLIEAANLLIKKHPDLKFYLFGKDTIDPVRGSMKAFLTSMIQPEMRDKFVFMGTQPRSELFTFYKKAAVAIFPSFMEAFAFAPLEAMSIGCPTIYSDQTSGKELISHMEDGLLIDPHNPRQIADAISSIISNPALAKKLSINGYQKSSNFSVERMEQETIDFYQYCIEQKRRKLGR